MSNLLAFHIFLASLETSHQCGRMVIWYDSCWFQQFSPLEKLLDIKIIQLVIALVEVYPLTINLIRKGHKKKAQHGVQRNQQAPTTMNWHLSSYHPFPPSLFWILRILSASLVNILGTSLKVLQDCKTGRFISILTPACLLEQKQQGVLQLQLRLCFTEMYRNAKILHVYEDRLQTSLLPRARTSHSKFHHCSGLIEIGRIRQPLDQKFFLASIQPPGLLESLMLDVLMSTFDSVLSSFATSLYSFQSECITTSWPSSVRACLWR